MKNVKINLEKDVLIELYINQNLTQQECANKLGVSSVIVKRRLKEFDIKKPKDKFKDIHKTHFRCDSKTIEKRKQTVLKKYGVENISQLESIKSKKEETAIRNYGVSNGSQKNYSKLFLDIRNNKDSSFAFMYENNNIYTIEELCDLLGASYIIVSEWLEKFNLRKYIKHIPTKTEDDIVSFIKSLKIKKIIRRTRKILGDGKELDIYLPDNNLAIEVNGTYWHSEIKKDKNYHFNKSLECESKRIRLIHIWQYEWEDINQREKIKMLLKLALGKIENKIYARQCEIKEINNKEAKKLNEKVHLQGHRNAQITYGLFYKENLVQLMSFSKTKYNKNLKSDNEWEIIRGCPGSNNLVVGGVSKLFKHFVKDYKPSKIFSYCDFNKFNGKSYEEIGMKFSGFTGPDMKYVLKNGKVVNRNPFRYEENIKNMKWRLFGSGSKKYVWEKY